jgi:hypothetical protein
MRHTQLKLRTSIALLLASMAVIPTAAAQAQTGPTYFTLRGTQSGMCLTAYPWVWQTPCTGATNQQWELRHPYNLYDQIVARDSGKCIAVPSSGLDGAKLILAPCGDTNTDWHMFYGSNGYRFKSQFNDKGLASSLLWPPGPRWFDVFQWTSDGRSHNQNWTLTRVTA